MAEKLYTFDEYLDTFCADMCGECRGSGVVGSLPLNTLRRCPDCDGTGRKDKRTIQELVRDARQRRGARISALNRG